MDRYSRNMIKASVAKMLQTIGWHTIHTTPIEMLTDILIQYMTQMAKLTADYCNEFGYVEPNLDHLGLVFREFHINLSDLEEYVTNVDFGPPVINVPKYPVPKENHLNFLKPGSKEVVTRPVHIHEHLPPMFSVQEASEAETEVPIKQEETDEANNSTTDSSAAVFKRPIEVSPGETFKRPRLLMEEEGRPTREISSVIMTTSGYISPAREGKLPESRTPLAAIEVAPPPINNVPPPVTNPKPKIVKKVEKKREKPGKELFKPLDDKAKKPAMLKDVAKLKQNKAVSIVNNTGQLPHNNLNNTDNVKAAAPPTKALANRENKTLAAARLKTEKLNTTITPIPMKPTAGGLVIDNIDKLFTEPDKKKVNILKKISCVKNEKVDNKPKVKDEIKQESREGSPVLVIDEPIEPPKVHISNDITIELVGSSPTINKTPEKVEKNFCYDESPPGTPLTPKTPEISHSPPLTKARNKRKDKTKVKKVPKSNPSIINPEVEIDVDVRPKTPEAQLDKHVIMALGLAQYTPGLIPPPVNPFFPNMQLPLRFPGFGKPPFMPLVPPYPMDFQQPMLRPKEPSIPLPKVLLKESAPQVLLPPTLPAPPIVVVDNAPPKPEKKPKEHKKEKKDKVKKKNKKDKVKDKAEKKKLKEEKKDKVKREKKEKKKEKEQLQCREIDSIPKLTLKLGSPAPNAESIDTRKLNIKPIVKKEEEPVTTNNEQAREMSPELAKISALVTGQPKPKNPNNISNDNFGTSSDSYHNQMKKTMFKPIPKKEVVQEPVSFGLYNPTPSSYIEDSIKDEMPANNPASRAGSGPGRPRIHPIKPKAVKAPKQQPPLHQVPIKDSEGNEVWICPGCDKQDDGSPMIGCDDCDAWYHWVCVGIQVPPDDNENWYCRHCLAKKREVLQCDKKKKRKKREKKEH